MLVKYNSDALAEVVNHTGLSDTEFASSSTSAIHWIRLNSKSINLSQADFDLSSKFLLLKRNFFNHRVTYL